MKGRPVLGVVAGLLFGVFVALDLVFFGVIASDSMLLVVLPLVGLVLGLLLAAWAPLGGRSGPAEPPAGAEPPAVPQPEA